MDKKTIIAASDNAINNAGRMIIDLAKKIWQNPETGYRETETSKLLVKTLETLGFKVKTGLAITGFRADLDTGRPGPAIAVMGELDALLIPGHPEAVNGVAHSCGHHTSAASLIGTAIGLKAAAETGGLCGRIAFIGAPAEEGIELEYRQSLIDSGRIGSIAGKSQLIREGVMDDIDIAFMHHLSNRYGFNDHNGSVCKKIVFSGKSCHASAPHKGINALNAMNLAQYAIALLRESYSNSDKVRFHGIISNGGQSVNILPDKVVMDYMLRAETVEKLVEVNRRFDNAVKHAAAAVECGVEIVTMHYSMPLYDDLSLGTELQNVVRDLIPDAKFDYNSTFFASCTDMGDIGTVIPSVHGYVPGMTGTSHGVDYYVKDYHNACVVPALINARLAIELLANDAAKGKVIAAGKDKLMPIPEYIRLIDSISGRSAGEV